jgi:hypothetical protein
MMGGKMKMRIAALLALSLAACSKEKAPDANKAAAPAAKPAIDRMVPGLYRQATTLLDLKDSSLQYEQAAAAAKAIGTTQTAERCVTPEMVANPEQLFREDTDPSCKIERNSWTGGKIDFAMTCPEKADQLGGKVTLSGNYDTSEYHFELSAEGTGEDRMKMRVDAKRLGDCKG